ncbi:MAG: general stress protein CsbD [Bacteroidetes bacterium]|nr:general stress protein CsbD [Bacteroidota bacterium]
MTDSPSITPTWAEKKAKLKAKFGLLVDSDLNFAEEKKDEMFARLNEKLGHTRAELEGFMAL